MHQSDWLIMATAAAIIVASAIAGARGGKSFLGVWVFVLVLAVNSFWINRYVPPWGAVVFFALPTVPYLLAVLIGVTVRKRP